MALTKILVRQFKFKLNTGTVAVPVWTEIKGIDTMSPSPSKQDADTTTFDDDGVETHMTAARGLSFTISGKMAYTDAERTTRDPGQAAAKAWAAEIGPESLKQFQIVYPDAVSTTDTFFASANTTDGGGGNNDPAAFSLEVTRSGATTTTTTP